MKIYKVCAYNESHQVIYEKYFLEPTDALAFHKKILFRDFPSHAEEIVITSKEEVEQAQGYRIDIVFDIENKTPFILKKSISDRNCPIAYYAKGEALRYSQHFSDTVHYLDAFAIATEELNRKVKIILERLGTKSISIEGMNRMLEPD